MSDPKITPALELLRHSVLKQAKLREIRAMLGDTRGEHCLDIGSDNGVISYLLRAEGGTWNSADLDETTVASIRELVGDDVHRIDGPRTYSGSFSEILNTAQRFAVDLAKGSAAGPRGGESKGAIVTGQDMDEPRKSFGMLKLTYPWLSLFSRLDHLLFLQEGYKLIVKAVVAAPASDPGASE